MAEEKKKKLNPFVKTNRKIGILLDSIKGFFIVLILFILIVFFLSAIVHNILRVVEASTVYVGDYKKLYDAGSGMVNLYQVGSGDKTLVILPSIGDSSPVFKYKALADSLSSSFRVVIYEPMGYGYSLSTKEKRTSENIISELRQGLEEAKIPGPYTLLAFSNSSLYADYYSKQFPGEVSGIIEVNGLYPQELENSNFKDDYLPNLVSNVKFYSIVSFSGLFRWETYISPDKYYIDKMQANSSYGDEEIKLYRNRISNKFLTKEMRGEADNLQKNMEDLKDYQFNDYLPTLQIITTDYRDECLGREENIQKYINNLITNKDIQRVRTIDGKYQDYLYTDSGIRELKSLINMYF